MEQFNSTFQALLKEAQFTKELLGAGATQIRRANYATKGAYFLAFTSLSTGLERIGKLCLMVDHYIETGGQFPDFDYLKNEIGHNLSILYERSQSLISRRGISLTFLQDLSDPIHVAMTRVLSNFAEGDRYANVNLLVRSRRMSADPIASWSTEVDLPIFQTRVTERRKQMIDRNAALVDALMGAHALVRHTSETGQQITDVESASRGTGIYEAVAPYRQLYVLHIIRYWTELLSCLEHMAHRLGKQDIPFLSELFGPFYNADSYMRTRKTWDDL
ncbi:hypothetical protein [Pandoraea pulmonicola]|uniref:Uncharacterized protein n=1 Tax=Pandoraea pulmonicola TaxID=93221 RepID=A0AAJ5D1Y0_PANPU|nr:hypothetical protein [Pandoraea pulmonicola]AJC19626.1 hypothetical protein RO07_02450 [Pandoraea pulmonicola]SUA92273.1 Uncharacterised protein [Pandoraea pulmonicola]